MRSGSIMLTSILQLAMVTAQAQEPDQKEQVTTQLPSITVTADREAFATAGIKADREEVKLTPGGVTLVEGDILRDRNISSLADMLRYVPGLFIQSDNGSDEIFFSSRGSNLDATNYDSNGIMLLQNGLPVTTADGNNHNRIIDPLSTRYAIVARGANGMKYGASTLGGAINFISPTAYDVPSAVLFLNGGSFGQLQGRATLSKVFNDRLDGLLMVEAKQRQGYRDHNQTDRAGVYANGGWRISQSLGTRLYATYVNNEQELPGNLTREEFKEDPDQASANALNGDFQKNVETWRLANKTTWQIAEHQRLEFGVSYEKQRLFHPIVADFAGDSPFFDGLLIETDHQDVGAMVRYEHQIANHNLLIGANYRVGEVEGKQFGNNQGEPGDLQTLVDQEADTLQAYVMDRWHIGEQWTLIPAVQFVNANRDINNSKLTNPDVPFAPPVTKEDLSGHYFAVNPRLGIIYHVQPEFDLFANVSRLYEPPTNFELDNPTTNDTGDVLDAMEGTVVEVGTRGNHAIGRASSWQWNLALYYAWIKNEILSVQDPNAIGTILTTNVDDTIHAGIEALIRARIAVDTRGVHTIAPALSLAVNEFRFDDDPNFGNNQLPAAPRYVLRGQVLYRHANGFYAGPTFDVVDDRYADLANSYPVDAYALLGFLAGWSNDHVDLYLQLENLLDEEYVATHSVVPVAATNTPRLSPGQPLAVYGGVTVRF